MAWGRGGWRALEAQVLRHAPGDVVGDIIPWKSSRAVYIQEGEKRALVVAFRNSWGAIFWPISNWSW